MARVSSIIRISDIDPTKLSLSEPKVQDSGGKIIYIQHNKQPLFVQLPTMNCPYGVSTWPIDKSDKNVGPTRMNLDLAMTDYDKNPIMIDAFNKLMALEEFVTEEAMKNSQHWFKKKLNSKDVLNAIFTPIIKFSKDKETGEITHKYPPVIRLSIPRKQEVADVEVFKSQAEQVTFENIDWKGAQVTSIVQIVSVWIIAGKFGISVKAKQLKVNPVRKLTGYAFIEDPDDENNVDADHDDV